MKRLSFFAKLMFVANLFLAACLLYAATCHNLDPAVHRFSGFFSLSFFIFLAANLLFFFYWLLKRNILLILPLLVLLFSSTAIKRSIKLFPSSHSSYQNESTEKSISIASYNVRNFDFYDWKNNLSTRNEMMAFICEESPDIIAFQEYFTNNAKFSNTSHLQNSCDYKHAKVINLISHGAELWGLSIFSKYPIINHGRLKFEDNYSTNGCLWVDINVAGDTVRVYNAHFQSNRLDEDMYEYIGSLKETFKPDIDRSKKLFTLLSQGFEKRSLQVKQVKAHMDESPFPVITCVDMNDVPTSFSYQEMSRGLNDSFLEKGWGIGKTYSGLIPILRIDFIFSDKKFVVKSYKKAGKAWSDHYPIFTELEL